MRGLVQRALFIVMFSLIGSGSVLAAEASETSEALKEHYMLVDQNQQEIVSYMKSENLTIEEIYSAFPIISAQLSADELAQLKNKFPKLHTQENIEYEQTTDNELESAKVLGASPSLLSPYTGAGVKVAILDSGIDVNHRDLKVKGGYCSLAFECAPDVPYTDDNGHGTHVAGILAALKNNTGIVGLAPSVDLYSVKAMNAFGSGSTDSLVSGIEWAIKNKMDIINMSITTDEDDVALRTALQTAYNKGILITASVGNNGETTNKAVLYPARYSSVIGVGAVKNDLTKMPESAVGPEVELVAPGDSILSTFPIEWDYEDGRTDGYTRLSGTSMAAPHVAGLLAIYKERFPKMTNVELRNLITSTAKDLGVKGRDNLYGFGLIQYMPELPYSVSFTKTNSTGKVVLSTTDSKLLKVVMNGKSLKLKDGQMEIYGVKGKKEIFVTSVDAQKKQTIERQYVEFSEPAYSDVKNSQPFSGSVGYLAGKKQIKGFQDGTFRPYTAINRGEAAVLIGRALGYSGTPTKTKFSDVSPSSYASGYIDAAVKAKVISGFTDGTFRPEANVTRAEMAIMISKAYQLTATSNKSFADVNSSIAAYKAIMSLANAGITSGYKDGTFKPYEKMTRSDFSVFLSRAQNDLFKLASS
ncbi:S8 family peptidase [Sporosarcina sp. SAFN-010]|uniref:S8 family peptidase n=1 Tax=Sporosarcina sp. SAFN-010 TaxID=3387273 RepID=UPI003F7E9940